MAAKGSASTKASNETALDKASPVAPLEISGREILKGTLVSLHVGATRNSSHALVKYSTVRQLQLGPGDTDAVRDHLSTVPSFGQRARDMPAVSGSTLDLLRSFEQPLLPALRPEPRAVAAVPVEELTTFVNTLVALRSQQVRGAEEERGSAPTMGTRSQALNAAVIAARGLAINTAIQPLGMLNLERIEMVPAGIQRGELIATIPLAPGEETAVTHKEWSVTSKEFTTIVTDSLESTSETGVTDNTDLSQSTTSQNQHSTQFNITGTVQGGIPMINGSSTAGVTAQDANSESASGSIKHATSMTQKASARSRQEHKTTISTTTVTGSAETSTRILRNPSVTDPIRIDYFSLMRKWRVRLYRFGLRLTYDMVIPEPGATLRRDYAELDRLRSLLGPFVFDVKYETISKDLVDQDGLPVAAGQPGIERYRWLAARKGVAVRAYPDSQAPLAPSVRGDGNRDWSYLDLQFRVPDGQEVGMVLVSTIIGKNDRNPHFKVLGARVEGDWLGQHPDLSLLDARVFAPDGITDFLAGAVGEQKVSFWFWFSSAIWVGLKVFVKPTGATIDQWRTDVWNALYNAAQTRYYAEQQEIAARIAALEEKLAHVDTLTLRREESDEIMKSILKFVLGSEFDLMPVDVRNAFAAANVDVAHGVGFDGSTVGLSQDQWSVLRHHEDIVRFINQAIEWENVVTFLYSYFWDVPASWEFIRALRHDDKSRQAFLRAGSARVVLTVRKGWEAKWMRFTEDWTFDDDITAPRTGPYLSIAQEIAAYDDRNYPGIAPANPSRSAARLQDAVFTTSSVKIEPSTDPVIIEVANSAGLVVGLPVILDIEDDRHIQEAVVVTDIPDASHIVVEAVVHAHDGTQTPVPLLQPGDKGALIAEWFEYTPSSGIDIAVTSNLATIA